MGAEIFHVETCRDASLQKIPRPYAATPCAGTPRNAPGHAPVRSHFSEKNTYKRPLILPFCRILENMTQLSFCLRKQK